MGEYHGCTSGIPSAYRASGSPQIVPCLSRSVPANHGQHPEFYSGRTEAEDPSEPRQLPLAGADLSETRPARFAAESGAALFPLRMELQPNSSAIWPASSTNPADPVHLEAPCHRDGIRSRNSARDALAKSEQDLQEHWSDRARASAE